jgi:hypothetical protein
MSEAALGELLMGIKKLYRVTLKPAEDSVEDRWGNDREWPSAIVASTSIENASLKTVQHFCKKNGKDYEVYEISEMASMNDDKNCYIE